VKIYKEHSRDGYISDKILTVVKIDDTHARGHHFRLEDIPGWLDGTPDEAWLEAETLEKGFVITGPRPDRDQPGFEMADPHYYSHRYWAFKKLRNTPKWGTFTADELAQWVEDNVNGLPDLIAFCVEIVNIVVFLRDHCVEHHQEEL
jgi:hypothetical protein